MAVICIEGADRTGKSTLIQSLVKDLGATVVHFPTTERPDYNNKYWFLEDFMHYRGLMMEARGNHDFNLILDRCWPSTFVYQGNIDADLMKILFPIDGFFLMTVPVDVAMSRMDKESAAVLKCIGEEWTEVDSKYKGLDIWTEVLDGTNLSESIRKVKAWLTR